MARFRRYIAGAALVVAAMMVAACGTTQVAQTPTPPPPTPPPPPPPAFSVVSTSPVEGATVVPVNTGISIKFSLPVATAGAGDPCAPGNIQIAPPPLVPYACSVAGDGVTVNLTGGLLRGSTPHTVTVRPQVSSSTGVQLGNPFPLHFSTGPGAFQVGLPAFAAAQWGTVASPNGVGAVIQAGLFTGDCEVFLTGPCALLASSDGNPVRLRAFFAFDLAPLGAPLSSPASVIIAAQLRGTQSLIAGDPYDVFAGGGPVVVDGVSYLQNGALDWPGDYNQAPITGPVLWFTTNTLQPETVDVTEIVRRAAAATTYVGFRVRWNTASGLIDNTDFLGDDDLVGVVGPSVTVFVLNP
jgi:hypothetical protein